MQSKVEGILEKIAALLLFKQGILDVLSLVILNRKC